MSDICLLCTTRHSSRTSGVSKLKARATMVSNPYIKIAGIGDIDANNSGKPAIKARLSGSSDFTGKYLLSHGLFDLVESGEGNISATLSVSGVIRSRIQSQSNFDDVKTEKFAGFIDKINSFDNFIASEKLYPINDIVTSLNNSSFVDKNSNNSNLYTNIDEGVIVGNFTKHGKNGQNISDEKQSYIHPSSVFTSGDFRYKCEVTTPLFNAQESFLLIRAAAPVSTYFSNIPPQYKLHNIKLEDPSGNLIIKYKDIIIRGDADYSQDYVNFATYISEPEINNLLLNTWDENYPLMDEYSGYTLNIDFNIQCLDDPFAEGFDKGYEDTCKIDVLLANNNDYLSVDGSPLSTQTQNFSLNPDNALRISAIEIANSGGFGIVRDAYLPIVTEINTEGLLLTRNLVPVDVVQYNEDIEVYPETYSLWESSPDSFENKAYNTSASGSKYLASKLQNTAIYDYVTLVNSDPINDSGRLTLKFGHSAPRNVTGYSEGPFAFGRKDQFDVAKLQSLEQIDNFFVIQDISLKVIAKKAIGSRDYALDVVGYSDDGVINITPRLGAFLQNTDSPIGDVPDVSGFKSIDDLGISSETLSDKSQYYLRDITLNPAKDHYVLSNTPVVSSIQFQEYNIPLTIYKDSIDIGRSIDYSNSSYFENLYVDLYPLPSGATIATAQLVITYKPSNALMLSTFGRPILKDIALRQINLKPSQKKETDDLFELLPDDGLLSLIENIPVGFSYPTKLNDSKRWRGVGGHIVNGPYDARVFDFSFYNPEIDTPFLSGYFNFNNTFNNAVYSEYIGSGLGALSGEYIGNLQSSKINNLGNRFRQNEIFINQYPALSSNYRTIDWTSLHNETENFINDPLYGKISDAYENAVRTSGIDGYLRFPSFITTLDNTAQTGGFGAFLRFTPDVNNSGINFNLFNSGVLLSAFEDSEKFNFILAYDNGSLCVKYKDADNETVYQITDSKKYFEYTYPLNILITYNEGDIELAPSIARFVTTIRGNRLIKLYVADDSSIDDENILRATSQVRIHPRHSDYLTVGYSLGSGIGFNMFVHEIGFTSNRVPKSRDVQSNRTVCNIIENELTLNPALPQNIINEVNPIYPYNRNNVFKFLLARDLFKSLSNKKLNQNSSLYSYIDDDTTLWKLGDFKICSFSADFDGFTKREGKDYIVHKLKHNGNPYSNIVDFSLPSNIYASGLSYHTQIENDSLRFYISDIQDDELSRPFYAAHPRISKTLPRGYKFVEDAIAVDTVLQHDTYNDIRWNDGNIGPKLIVSLYTTNQNPVDRPSKQNWGLINRSIHFLEPSGCWQKITSKFTPGDLFDKSEPWANFDPERNITEFTEKYFSKDIDDMFLQYDLVYPSGSPFESTIKIHSANVRLQNALVTSQEKNTQFNLSTSGEKKWLDNLNLFVDTYGIHSTNLDLFISGDYVPVSSSIFNLFSSGAYYDSSSLRLFTFNKASLNSSIGGGNFGDLFGSEYYLGPNLFIGGRTNQFNDEILPLIVTNKIVDQSTSGALRLFTSNVVQTDINNASLNFSLTASPKLSSVFSRASLPLRLETQPVGSIAYSYNNNNVLQLYINTVDPRTFSRGRCNLFTINYSPFNQVFGARQVIVWDSDNPGSNINVDDNDYAYLEANDEIRGVDIICYGNCLNPKSCKEDQIYMHEQIWKVPYDCIDGGIFRAKNTYTNLATSGFKTEIGYSGHFYGIRKYTGLLPNSPYEIIVAGQTGNNESVPLPVEFVEMEYGSNDDVNYSGIKLVADKFGEDYRQANDKYGKSVSIKRDVMAVGAPFHELSYTENNTTYNLEEAGAVFIYKRDPRPSGYSWPSGQDKSDWKLETRLTLPSGLIKDYYNERQISQIGSTYLPLPAKERSWVVGQEGRQFGHSLDLAISLSGEKSLAENDRQVLVVSGPSAKWSRTFEGLETSGVQIGLIIFTDEFTPSYINGSNTLDYNDVLDNIKNKDILYKYFASPAVNFDVKLIICEPIAEKSNRILEEFPNPKPTFITKKRIARNQGRPGSEIFINQTAKILSGIKEAFHEAFPYDQTKLHNNVPVILGLYVDNSRSLGRDSVNPAIDQFIQYYKEYSFASGLRDFYGVVSSGAISEFIPDFGAAENWISMSNDILDNVLDTGRLIRDNQVRFITSGVGIEYFNPNLTEFNLPPDSGGRVYVFEKESGSWNLTQEIATPFKAYGIPDRFGHSVSISDNAEVIAIGSPYISEACKVYEYKANEKTRLYSAIINWLNYKISQTGGLVNRYTSLQTKYNNTSQLRGSIIAGQELYISLNSTEKFEARRYLNIQEYQNILTYGYGDISSIGTWDFITERFVPTSRLGYSTAVNEDGSIVAFGAPTDSTNEWEDNNIYYKNDGYDDPNNVYNLNTSNVHPTWKSYVNAGAVRVFESRKYYPHKSVVEFTKFGNLQESLNDPIDSGHFNYLSGIFSDKNFRKTEFTDVEIPQDAGLAFIITPEVDSLSEEVGDNIASWLALGDRNLVLVGNDPTWEKNGIYSKSNEIINKILTRLNSRMRIHSARNQYEALVSGCMVEGHIIPSTRPNGATSTFTYGLPLKGYGVGDIRMHLPSFERSMPCDLRYPGYGGGLGELVNKKCELPLVHNGDLRAQWMEYCLNCRGDIVPYSVNWPFIFKNFEPGCCEPIEDSSRLDLKNFEPIPILSTADYIVKKTVIPASPEISGFRPVYKTVFNSYIPVFDEGNISSGVEFYWTSSGNNYTYLGTNIGNSISEGVFFTPSGFADRQSLLQSKAISYEQIKKENQIVSPAAYYCVTEQHENTSSNVVVIAGTQSESSYSLYAGAGDQNLNFYVNLVAKTKLGESSIVFLGSGSWTGRTSFADANSDSILEELFINTGNEVRYDSTLYSTDDVCWIADPTNLPTEQDIQEIKQWLNRGNKRLIITYAFSRSEIPDAGAVDEKMNFVKELLSKFSNIKPIYLSVKEEYPIIYANAFTFTPNTFVSNGFDKASSIDYFDGESFVYVPLVVDGNVRSICYDPGDIVDDKFDTLGYWRFRSGVTKVTFPAVAGSGYKIFIDTVSETPSENALIYFDVTEAGGNPGYPYPPQFSGLDNNIYDYPPTNNNRFVVDTATYKGYQGNLRNDAKNKIQTISFNVQAIENTNSISVYFYNNTEVESPNIDYQPKTIRVHAISGVAMPISRTVTTKEVIDYWEPYLISSARPEIVSYDVTFKELENDNTKYCNNRESCLANGLGNQLIKDGPVVAAQEQELVSSFNAGYARSRITVLSDSSLVQGRCMVDDQNRMSSNTVAFIRSLYPSTFFGDVNSGRQFNQRYKIMSPERGSPIKYNSVLPNSGLTLLFNGNLNVSSLSNLTDKESLYNPKYVKRTKEPWGPQDDWETIQRIKRTEIAKFISAANLAGAMPRFSGVIDGVVYDDAGRTGGMPKLMEDKGYDYLDFDKAPSGFKGDLFGYSIDLQGNKLIVGSPFSAFSSNQYQPWSYFIENNGSDITASYNGGAGSVYLFERTFKGSGIGGAIVPWQFMEKVRPNDINVGHDLNNELESQSNYQLGSNNYSSQFLSENSFVTDQFGYDVSIDGDILLVGAPGHDFDNYSINTYASGEFIRKCFNPEFDIPSRTVTDLGNSGIRGTMPNSGIAILNRGAVFAFENKIVDWPTKKQQWIKVEKIVPQGYKSNTQSSGLILGNENDAFGRSVSVDRARRSDSDYVVGIGAMNHGYAASGNNNEYLDYAGAAYTYDIMLREVAPAVQSPDAYIDANIFGERNDSGVPAIRLRFENENNANFKHYATGVVYTNNQGEIFIEASGQDPVLKGLISHRPYILSVNGQYKYGIQNSGIMPLYVEGKIDVDNNINLFTHVDNVANVYNNIGLYNGGVTDIVSNDPSGLVLYVHTPDPTIVSESGLMLYASGIGFNTDTINLSIRGR
jgi:hypothetical protein